MHASNRFDLIAPRPRKSHDPLSNRSNKMRDSFLEVEDEDVTCDNLAFAFSKFAPGASPTSTLLDLTSVDDVGSKNVTTQAQELVDFFQECYVCGDGGAMATRISPYQSEWRDGPKVVKGRAEISKYLTEQWGAQKNRTQTCELYVGSATRVVMSVEREWSDANEPWKTISEKGMVCWELDAGLVSKRVFVVEPSASA